MTTTTTKNAFMTPEQLGILPEEFASLCDWLELAEQGKIVHITDRPCRQAWELEEFPESRPDPSIQLFNMSVIVDTIGEFGWSAQGGSCGTVCCLSGWVQLQTGIRYADGWNGMYGDRTVPSSLVPLYYPDRCPAYYEDITVEMAARTLRGFLSTSKVSWTE